jgi:tRNA(fMet)-specific endonuclease VapC
MGLILDTNFVITTEREARRGIFGRADRFLTDHSDESLFITFTVAAELACGESATPRKPWERLCQRFPILPWSADVSWQYGQIYRTLAAEGKLIGANDLWIAATALANDMAVVTNNQSEFQRVPGLEVITY